MSLKNEIRGDLSSKTAKDLMPDDPGLDDAFAQGMDPSLLEPVQMNFDIFFPQKTDHKDIGNRYADSLEDTFEENDDLLEYDEDDGIGEDIRMLASSEAESLNWTDNSELEKMEAMFSQGETMMVDANSESVDEDSLPEEMPEIPVSDLNQQVQSVALPDISSYEETVIDEGKEESAIDVPSFEEAETSVVKEESTFDVPSFEEAETNGVKEESAIDVPSFEEAETSVVKEESAIDVPSFEEAETSVVKEESAIDVPSFEEAETSVVKEENAIDVPSFEEAETSVGMEERAFDILLPEEVVTDEKKEDTPSDISLPEEMTEMSQEELSFDVSLPEEANTVTSLESVVEQSEDSQGQDTDALDVSIEKESNDSQSTKSESDLISFMGQDVKPMTADEAEKALEALLMQNLSSTSEVLQKDEFAAEDESVKDSLEPENMKTVEIDENVSDAEQAEDKDPSNLEREGIEAELDGNLEVQLEETIPSMSEGNQDTTQVDIASQLDEVSEMLYIQNEQAKEQIIESEEPVQMDANVDKKEEEKKPVDAVTVITKGTKIEGSINADGSLEVHGVITGDVTCLGKLTILGTVLGNAEAKEVFINSAKLKGGIRSDSSVKIGVGTVITGDVYGNSAVVAGAVKGNFDIDGPVIVDSTAVIKGNITAKSIQINNGAIVDGYCSLSYSEVDIDSFFTEE